jgi:hypothetical protein
MITAGRRQTRVSTTSPEKHPPCRGKKRSIMKNHPPYSINRNIINKTLYETTYRNIKQT